MEILSLDRHGQKVLDVLGFDRKSLEEEGIRLTDEMNRVTRILCPKCRVHLFNFVGPIDFSDKVLHPTDLKPVGRQDYQPTCCICKEPWLYYDNSGGVRSGHLWSERGWIPQKHGLKNLDF